MKNKFLDSIFARWLGLSVAFGGLWFLRKNLQSITAVFESDSWICAKTRYACLSISRCVANAFHMEQAFNEAGNFLEVIRTIAPRSYAYLYRLLLVRSERKSLLAPFHFSL